MERAKSLRNTLRKSPSKASSSFSSSKPSRSSSNRSESSRSSFTSFSSSRFSVKSSRKQSSNLKTCPEDVASPESEEPDLVPEQLSVIAKWDLPKLIKAIFARYSDCADVSPSVETGIVGRCMYDIEGRMSDETQASAHCDLTNHHFPLNLSILVFLAPLMDGRAKHESPYNTLLMAYFQRPVKRHTAQRFLHAPFPARQFLQELCSRGLKTGRSQTFQFRSLMVHVKALCEGVTRENPKWAKESLTISAIPSILSFDSIIARNQKGMENLEFISCAPVEYDILHSLLQIAPLPCPRQYLSEEICSGLLDDILQFYNILVCNDKLDSNEKHVLKRLKQEQSKMPHYDLEGQELERTVLGGAPRAIEYLEREMRATPMDPDWNKAEQYVSVWGDVWHHQRKELLRRWKAELEPSLASARRQKWNFVSSDSRERQRIYDMAQLLLQGFKSIAQVRTLTERKTL